MAPNRSSCSSGTALPRPAATLKRELAGTVNVLRSGMSASRIKSIVTVAAVLVLLASRMNVSADSNRPVWPSARPQRVRGAVTPKELCASYQNGGANGQYCDRSTTTGMFDCTRVATAALSSAVEPSASMSTVRRPLAGTILLRVTVTPASVTNVSVTSATLGFGLAISTNVSKKAPVAPSARNQSVDGA